jgi:AraC-like DNA-binding protein
MAEMGTALTEEVAQEAGQCALVFLRSAQPITRSFRYPEPTFLFARGATRLSLTTPKRTLALSASQVVALAPDTACSFKTKSSTTELLIVRPRPRLIDATAVAYKHTPEQFTTTLARTHVFARQRWLDEVHHRYFYERVVCEKHDNVATAFLEMEIVKEVYFVVAQAESERGVVPFFEDEAELGARAVRQVEATLYDPLSLDELAKTLSTSRATLVRRFRERTGKAPAEYVRERRLDEAHKLLERANTTVSEVALTVGYENVSAFAQAYRRKFGMAPSARRAK